MDTHESYWSNDKIDAVVIASADDFKSMDSGERHDSLMKLEAAEIQHKQCVEHQIELNKLVSVGQ